MKIVVIGGSGRIGSRVVAQLAGDGHEVLAASPGTGVDTLTGEGLTAALDGAQVVVDVTNSPSWDDADALDFFLTSTQNLLAAELAAGVGHHVALSVVGTDRLLASGFFRAKIVQESLIRTGVVPYTIVRATQFFEFVASIAESATDGDVVRLPPALIQPMAADDVAAAVGRVAVGSPVNGIVEVAGPETFRLDELVRLAFRERSDPRQVVTDPTARYFGWTELEERTLVPASGATLGSLRFEDWLAQTAPVA